MMMMMGKTMTVTTYPLSVVVSIVTRMSMLKMMMGGGIEGHDSDKDDDGDDDDDADARL